MKITTRKNAILIALSLAIVMSVAGCTSTPSSSADPASTASTKESASSEKESKPAKAADAPYEVELSSGHYTAGVDFPEGKYDIEAIAGGGNVISDNMMSGGINAVMGTEEANKAFGSDMYEQKYSNIKLDEGTKLSVSGVTVKITSKAASGAPLKPRNQSITEVVELSNGNFVAGEDFEPGIYDIEAVSGGGNVMSDNMMAGGINAVFGTADQNAAFGSDLYESAYKNVELTEGVTLEISGVDIKMTPSK